MSRDKIADSNIVSDEEWERAMSCDLNQKREYEVGYKKPPKHTQFKKGQSGNGKGKPKRSQNLKTDLLNELSERITIKENGRKLIISKQALMIKSMTAKAIKGDTRAASIVIGLVAQTMGLDPQTGKEEDLSVEDAAILSDHLEFEMEVLDE